MTCTCIRGRHPYKTRPSETEVKPHDESSIEPCQTSGGRVSFVVADFDPIVVEIRPYSIGERSGVGPVGLDPQSIRVADVTLRARAVDMGDPHPEVEPRLDPFVGVESVDLGRFEQPSLTRAARRERRVPALDAVKPSKNRPRTEFVAIENRLDTLAVGERPVDEESRNGPNRSVSVRRSGRTPGSRGRRSAPGGA